MRSGSASSILGCMHPWTTARLPPFLPCHFWCTWKAPFPLQGWPCLLPSFLPPRGCPWPLCLYRQDLHLHSAGRVELAAGACEGCRWTVSSTGPNGPLPRCRGRTSWRQVSPSPELPNPSCLSSVCSPSSDLTSLAYPASVFCLLTPSAILHPYHVRKNSEPKC